MRRLAMPAPSISIATASLLCRRSWAYSSAWREFTTTSPAAMGLKCTTGGSPGGGEGRRSHRVRGRSQLAGKLIEPVRGRPAARARQEVLRRRSALIRVHPRGHDDVPQLDELLERTGDSDAQHNVGTE